MSSSIFYKTKFDTTIVDPRSPNVDHPILLDTIPFKDFRGSFEVSWDRQEFSKQGIIFNPNSNGFSYNKKIGTIRGLHYQKSPYFQAKVVSCIAGSIFDVVVDVRPESPTYLNWISNELSSKSGLALFIPAGFAHGFLTLTDNAIITYIIEGEYVPEAASTLRWNDPSIGIQWPISNPILSEKDLNAPDFLL